MKSLCLIETPFPEKFGVPRQPLLIEEAWGKLVFPKNDFYVEAFRGIENFSHLWLIFEFHQVNEAYVSALVRPPRFEGKKKFGVFATRSPHRPNRLGLSVVKFDRLEVSDKEVVLWVRGVDLVSGTPIYDIKPYIPYVDARPDATALEFDEAPVTKSVRWQCEKPHDADLIEQVIALDPRPAHERDEATEFGVAVGKYNVRFREEQGVFLILSVSLGLNL